MKKQLSAVLVFSTFLVTPLIGSERLEFGDSESSSLVRKYDKNDDGKLNADEYPRHYRMYFGATDANRDGYVEASEITARMEGIISRHRERLEARARETRERRLRQLVEAAFARDANADGKLNADEASDILEEPFGEADSDEDGYLSRAEIEASLGLKSQAAKTIVETAEMAGSFKTLLQAAAAAELAGALGSEGPLTVFAPTDEAFAKLPKKTLAALLKDKEKLAAVLKYHIVAGNVLAKDVIKLSEATTLQGDSVTISVSGAGVKIDKANVVKTDINCSNGVIHVIDAVLLPGANESPQEKSIVQTAAEAGSFTTLLKAAKAAGLVEALDGDSQLTVFAPTDEAFAKLPEGTVEGLLKPENKDQLIAILTYHVVPGKIFAKDVVELKQAKTLQGQSFPISVTDAGVKVGNANVVKTDITCSNGVIHVIDSVILPELAEVSASEEKQLVQIASGTIDKQWRTVNDGVMGGRSEGKARLTSDNTLEFYGNLSLRNNGGFASVRSMSQKLELADGDTLVARVRGDGRQYSLNLYVPARRMAFSYRTPIQTEDGQWVEIRVPLSDFYATSFGRRVSGADLKPSQVNSIGFMLADKKSGPFRLEVESIRIAKSGE